jgi:hypothetical protein
MFKIRMVLLALCFLSVVFAGAQRPGRFVSVAVTNQHSAYPFSVFAGLFAKDFHPGFEVGYGFNWKSATKHDWYQAFKAGYFYHRFVQHAIPLYTQFGYRYKLQEHFRFSAALGAGYLHSVPATAVLKMDSDGTYKNAKGIGRGQALLNFTIGALYNLSKSEQNATDIFLEYGQEIQTPFIKSYVPLLPYNHIALGITHSLNAKK